MKFLITGAKGQLAREFQKTLNIFKHSFIALDKDRLDITNLETVEREITEYSPDIVLNCASYNYVDKAESDFEEAYKVNAIGVKNLAQVCKNKNILLIHYSTDYVFDGEKGDFYTEDDLANPINKYGISKLAGERFLSETTDEYIIFRLSWVFGEGNKNFLHKLYEWSKNNKILKIVCDQISVPTYTEDIASVTLFAINKGLRGLYHLTNSGYATRYEVARYFIEKLYLENLILPVKSDYFKTPAKRPYFSAMSNNKLSNLLNITIPDWRLGVDRYIEKVYNKIQGEKNT
jgi:dTDP-4-dehydrorhamnose reductase